MFDSTVRNRFNTQDKYTVKVPGGFAFLSSGIRMLTGHLRRAG